MIKKLLLCFCFIGLICAPTFAQTNQPITINGLILDAETLSPLGNTNLLDIQENKRYGKSAQDDGRFVISAMPNDTIHFSRVGFKSSYVVVPQQVVGNEYAVIQMLEPDTTMLANVTILDYPTLEDNIDNAMALGSVDSVSVPNVTIVTVYHQERNAYFAQVYQRFTKYWMHHNYNIPKNQWINPWVWRRFIKNEQSNKYAYLEMEDMYNAGPNRDNIENQYIPPSRSIHYEMILADLEEKE